MIAPRPTTVICPCFELGPSLVPGFQAEAESLCARMADAALTEIDNHFHSWCDAGQMRLFAMAAGVALAANASVAKTLPDNRGSVRAHLTDDQRDELTEILWATYDEGLSRMSKL